MFLIISYIFAILEKMDQWKALDRVVTILAGHSAALVATVPNNDDIHNSIKRSKLTELFRLGNDRRRGWEFVLPDLQNLTLHGRGNISKTIQHNIVVSHITEGNPPDEQYFFDIQITFEGNVLNHQRLSTRAVEDVITYLDHIFPLVAQ
jgi:hypothetical protein